MTKSLLIVSLVIVLVLIVCPIIVTLVVSKQGKEKELYKKILTAVSLVDLIVVIILLSLWISPIKNNEITYKKSDSKTTTSQAEEDDALSEAGFTEVSIDKYLELIKSDSKNIVLVARPTCYYCQQFTPILKQAKDELGLTINYVNTDNFSEDDWTAFNDSLDYLSQEDWGTPLTLIVQNGKVVDSNNGYVELETIKKFFTDNGFGE